MTADYRVLVVSNHWGARGNTTSGGVFVDRQVEALRTSGVAVDTFNLLTTRGVRRFIKSFLELRCTARSGYDIVHARYGTLVALSTVLVARPTVVTYAGSDLLPGAGISLLRTWLGIALSNIASLWADAVICVSLEMKNSLWFRSSRAIVIPDGVNLALFRPGDRLTARQTVGWGSEPVVLAGFARDPINKGKAVIEAAVSLIRETRPDVRLVVLDAVEPNEVPRHMQASDVLVVASRQEGSPNLVKEALACGLPVVGTAVGDIPERLRLAAPSEVVPRTAEGIAAGIERVLQSGLRCDGNEAIRDADMDTVVAAIRSVYVGVLEAARMKGCR